jgi:hypothetical protein
MLSRNDFLALFFGQLVITLALMAVVAKRHCLGDCENLWQFKAAESRPLALAN